MTFPPQQPGPQGGQNPYGNQGQWGRPGQQPGGYPPGGSPPGGSYPPSGPQQFGQQPGGAYPPSGPQQSGQPGQFGQAGPAGQPAQFGQPGQPDQWGQQAPMGYPGGFGAEPPKKKKTGLIIGIVAAVVVVVCGGVTALVLLLGGPDLSTPEGLQDAAVDAYNSRDVADFDPLYCTPPSDADRKSLEDAIAKLPAGVTYSVAQAPEVNGDSATLKLQASAAGQTRSFELSIKKSGDKWCMPSA